MENEIFKNSKFDNLNKIIYDKCTFIECDFSNINIEDVSFLDSSFIECKMVGVNISSSYLKNVLFDKCKMNLFIIGDSNIINVKFSNSSLVEGSLYNNVLNKKNYVFDNNDMSNITIYDSMNNVSLVNNNINGININYNNIKGSIISKDQTIILCGLLGVKMED